MATNYDYSSAGSDLYQPQSFLDEASELHESLFSDVDFSASLKRKASASFDDYQPLQRSHMDSDIADPYAFAPHAFAELDAPYPSQSQPSFDYGDPSYSSTFWPDAEDQQLALPASPVPAPVSASSGPSTFDQQLALPASPIPAPLPTTSGPSTSTSSTVLPTETLYEGYGDPMSCGLPCAKLTDTVNIRGLICGECWYCGAPFSGEDFRAFMNQLAKHIKRHFKYKKCTQCDRTYSAESLHTTDHCGKIESRAERDPHVVRKANKGEPLDVYQLRKFGYVRPASFADASVGLPRIPASPLDIDTVNADPTPVAGKASRQAGPTKRKPKASRGGRRKPATAINLNGGAAGVETLPALAAGRDHSAGILPPPPSATYVHYDPSSVQQQQQMRYTAPVPEFTYPLQPPNTERFEFGGGHLSSNEYAPHTPRGIEQFAYHGEPEDRYAPLLPPAPSQEGVEFAEDVFQPTFLTEYSPEPEVYYDPSAVHQEAPQFAEDVPQFAHPTEYLRAASNPYYAAPPPHQDIPQLAQYTISEYDSFPEPEPDIYQHSDSAPLFSEDKYPACWTQGRLPDEETTMEEQDAICARYRKENGLDSSFEP